MTTPIKPEEFASSPYRRVLIYDAESDTYTGKIEEFPGCILQGDTAEETNRRLEEVGALWIADAQDLGQDIPEPRELNEYRGRFALRLPKSLHRRAAEMADVEGVSLNQFIVAALAEHLGKKHAEGQRITQLGDWVLTQKPIQSEANTEAETSGSQLRSIKPGDYRSAANA